MQFTARLRQALRRRRGLSGTDVQHFTEEYKPGFSNFVDGGGE